MPAGWHALGPRPATMQTYDRAADCKPQTDTAGSAFDGAMVELLEDALEVRVDGAAAEVLDRHDQLASRRLDVQAYYRSRRRVLRGVLEEIAEGLLDQDGIDAHQR